MGTLHFPLKYLASLGALQIGKGSSISVWLEKYLPMYRFVDLLQMHYHHFGAHHTHCFTLTCMLYFLVPSRPDTIEKKVFTNHLTEDSHIRARSFAALIQ